MLYYTLIILLVYLIFLQDLAWIPTLPWTDFIDASTIKKYDLYPIINGLSDHDSQLLILNKVQKKEKECHTYSKRKINNYNIADFQLKLSCEQPNILQTSTSGTHTRMDNIQPHTG
jgi:hypothetical protein